MGSPEFAVPSLRLLASDHRVKGVVSQPDRRSGRGRRLMPAPVKTVALEMGLEVITPNNLDPRESQVASKLLEWRPDVIVVVAYGQILKPEMLELPRYGCLNLHASLLPRHRGASPVSAAIQAGDDKVGVTTIIMDEGIDTGPVLSQRAIQICNNYTAGLLTEKLACIGSELLLGTLPDYLEGNIIPKPQDHSKATYTLKLSKSDGHLKFDVPAIQLERQVRAMNPWPGAYAVYNGQPIKILEARVVAGDAPLGRVVVSEGDVGVGTSDGLLMLGYIQPSSGRPMSAREYVRGKPDFVSSTLE